MAPDVCCQSATGESYVVKSELQPEINVQRAMKTVCHIINTGNGYHGISAEGDKETKVRLRDRFNL